MSGVELAGGAKGTQIFNIFIIAIMSREVFLFSG
jgi:hypothetical protein